MKITKLVHSCLLVEENNIVVLIDPGSYSLEEKALSVHDFEKLDYLLITHEHADHFNINFVKAIQVKFPHLSIITNKSVVDLLKMENVYATFLGNKFIEIFPASHEHIFGIDTPPENVMFKLFGKLLHPGDSKQFVQTPEILALPIQAPWGNTTELLEHAANLNPKIVIAIHDWHYRPEAREGIYSRASDFFNNKGIAFHGIERGIISGI